MVAKSLKVWSWRASDFTLCDRRIEDGQIERSEQSKESD